MNHAQLLTLMKSLRQNLSCRFDLLKYIVSKANERDEHYEYFVTINSIKRISRNGDTEVVLITPVHRVKANYFYELEVFAEQGFYSKYKNLEAYYEQNGYKPVTPLTAMQLIKRQLQNSNNEALLKWLSEVK